MSTTVKSIFQVVNKAKKPTILMDGYIGKYDKINLRNFQRILNDLEADNVTDCDLLINSGGGSTIEGLTIGDTMRNSSISFHGIVIGMAASMGGGILMFCEKRSAYKNARVMTHKAKAGEFGEAEALRSMADLCDQEEEKIILQFVEATGKPEKEVRKWFKPSVNKWFTAQDCLKHNIVQNIIEPTKKTNNLIPENLTEEKELVNAYQSLVASYLPQTETEINLDLEIMNKKEILVAMLAVGMTHNLTENSTDGEFQTELEKVFAQAKKADEYKNKLDTYLTSTGNALITQGVKQGKIPANEKDQWLADYIDNPALVTKALQRMSGKPNLNNGLEVPEPNNGLDDEPKHALLKGREKWTLNDWQEKAPTDLQTLENEAPEEFEVIFNKQYK